jgi:hypothetical protein
MEIDILAMLKTSIIVGIVFALGAGLMLLWFKRDDRHKCKTRNDDCAKFFCKSNREGSSGMVNQVFMVR